VPRFTEKTVNTDVRVRDCCNSVSTAEVLSTQSPKREEAKTFKIVDVRLHYGDGARSYPFGLDNPENRVFAQQFANWLQGQPQDCCDRRPVTITVRVRDFETCEDLGKAKAAHAERAEQYWREVAALDPDRRDSWHHPLYT
jgi:hypothetical protein